MNKMQHCFYCGEELGIYDADYRDLQTCGKSECEREARSEEQAARSDAHEQLDRDMGW